MKTRILTTVMVISVMVMTFMALSIVNASASTFPDTFCNPINIEYNWWNTSESFQAAADPVIKIFKGEYYLFASQSAGYWWSSDMVNWNFVKPTGLNVVKYAPSVLVIGDTMYYTSSENGNIYKTNDPKAGVWETIRTNTGFQDPYLFLDDDGRVYCYYGLAAHGSISVVELDPNNNMSQIGSPIVLISSNKAENGYEVFGDDNTNYDGDSWFEGAIMTKYNGKYYLQYAVPGTEMRSYCDGYYISDSPTGPFTLAPNSPATMKQTGFVTGTGHGDLFQDLHGNWWKIDCVTISVKHMFERRLAIIPAGFDEDGLLYTNTEFCDYPQYIPGVKSDPVKDNSPGWYLLSFNKPVTASSVVGPDYAPSNAVDENIRTSWSATSGNVGEWLQIDLEKSKTVHAIQVNFGNYGSTYYDADQTRPVKFSYKYLLEYSLDGTTWHVLADKSNNDKEYCNDYIQLPEPVNARYIRITNKGPYPGYGNFSIMDLRVFGKSDGDLPGKVETVKVARQADRRSAVVYWNSVPNAEGYIIRYGIAPDKLYNHYQVLSGTATSFKINSLVVGQEYYFTVDAYNENGITRSNVIGENLDTTLSSLKVNGKQLGEFNPNVYQYSMILPEGITSIPQVEATANDPNCTVTITQASTLTGQAKVTVSNEYSQSVYTINFGYAIKGSDEFSDILGSQWRWVRENPNNWSLAKNPGAMTITSESGDLEGSTNTAKNILIQDAPGDWVMESKMVFLKRPSSRYEQAGIIAYQDDDNYLKLTWEYNSFFGTASRFVVLGETNGRASTRFTVANAQNIVGNENIVWFRMVKKGNKYSLYYSVDGKEFILIGTTEINLSDVKAGLVAFNRSGTSTDFIVTYDYFHIDSLGEYVEADESEISVNATFNLDRLIPNKTIMADVKAKNNSTEEYKVMVIVALYDKDDRMINVSYISKPIPGGASENLFAGFKLPKDVTDHLVKVFVWEGENLDDSSMVPLSNVVQLTT